MQRSAYILTIQDGMEMQYRKLHEEVWPNLIEAASRCGVKNHSSFVHGRQVIVYIEAEHLENATSRLAKEDVKIRWNRLMESVLEPDVIPFEEVFHMD